MSQGALPSTVVSVNGVPLGSGSGARSSSSSNTKRKLGFGDVVTIATNKGDKEAEWEHIDFLFKVGGFSSSIKLPILNALYAFYCSHQHPRQQSRIIRRWKMARASRRWVGVHLTILWWVKPKPLPV